MILNDKGFDQWAKAYDEAVKVTEEREAYPFAGYQDVINLVYQMAGHGTTSTILDVGFGTGTLTKRLYDDGHRIYGIDFSSEMMAIAQAKMPQAYLMQKDIEDGLPLEIADEKFDAIISTYALHHLTDRKKLALIQRLSSLLSEGGTIIIGDVSFETRDGHDQCKQKSGQEWDSSEYYMVFDEIKAELMSLKLIIEYKQISHCGGVLLIRPQ